MSEDLVNRRKVLMAQRTERDWNIFQPLTLGHCGRDTKDKRQKGDKRQKTGYKAKVKAEPAAGKCRMEQYTMDQG